MVLDLVTATTSRCLPVKNDSYIHVMTKSIASMGLRIIVWMGGAHGASAQSGFEVKGSLNGADQLFHCYELPDASFRCIGGWYVDTYYVVIHDFNELGATIQFDTILPRLVSPSVLLPRADGGCHLGAWTIGGQAGTAHGKTAGLIRLLPGGDTLWTRQYPLAYGSWFHKFVPLPSGDMVALGSVAPSDTEQDFMFMAFIDTAGGLLDTVNFPIRYTWVWPLNPSFHYHPGNGFFIAGIEETGSNYGSFIMMLDDSGTVLQKREMINLDMPGVVHIVYPLTGFSGYVPGGPMRGYFAADVFGSENISDPLNLSVALVKHQGIDTIWLKRYGTRDPYRDDRTANVIRTDDGNLLIGATWNFGTGWVFETNSDFWLTKVDTNGVVLWERKYGDNNAQELYDVIQTSDGGFLMTGVYGLVGGSVVYPDYYLIKTDSNGLLTHINGDPVSRPLLNISPNPTHDRVNITWHSATQPDQVIITNITGRQVAAQTPAPSRNYAEFDCGSFPSGLYICTLIGNNHQIVAGKLLKQ
jgi:hypothetical protein